jgi:Anthrax toxin LF subunit
VIAQFEKPRKERDMASSTLVPRPGTRTPPQGVRSGSALSDIPFQAAFQEVADQKDVVIGIREPNSLGAPLLHEGYASKSFHIKAKSSVSGPTAGFVAADPIFGKAGPQGVKKQTKYIEGAIEHGAGKVPLRLSDDQAKRLEAQGLIQWDAARETIVANYAGSMHRFLMRRDDPTSDTPWAVFYESGQPVEILTNPQRLGSPHGAKAAVTADYDLFSLSPRPNRSYNLRPLTQAARLVGPNTDGIAPHANKYLNAIRFAKQHKHSGNEDPDLGNMHYYGQTIKNALNAKIATAGYRGGLLVHHNDETGNPFSPGQDFPLRFLVPHGPAILVEDDAQLAAASDWFRQLGYAVETNPAFAFRSF